MKKQSAVGSQQSAAAPRMTVYVSYKNSRDKGIASVALKDALRSLSYSWSGAEELLRAGQILWTDRSYFCASRAKLATFLGKKEAA